VTVDNVVVAVSVNTISRGAGVKLGEAAASASTSGREANVKPAKLEASASTNR